MTVPITEVTTGVADLGEAERFYGATLGLPVSREDVEGAVVVRVGSTRLRLQHRPDEVGCDHLAVTIPGDGFDAAKRWLRDRVDLLERDGDDEFEGPAGWDSRSLYFSGPSGCVLELIARRRLPDALGRGPFTIAGLRCISEVGVAVQDVPDAVRILADAGLQPFGGVAGDSFAAVGDERGLIVLAAEHRAWAPTDDRRAIRSPLHVTATGVTSAELRIGLATLAIAGPEPRGRVRRAGAARPGRTRA